MKQTIEVSVPQEWSDVKLKTYVKFMKSIEDSQDDEKFLVNMALRFLCNLDAKTIAGIGKKGHEQIAKEVSKLLAKQEKQPLVKSFTIDGIEYAIDPDIENMSYGAYLDLTSYGQDVWENMGEICAILYRPVESKVGEHYSIKPYKGTTDELVKKFNDFLTMDIAHGIVFFFLNLERDLVSSSLDSLLEKLITDETLVQQEHSKVSGKAIAQLLSYAKRTLPGLMK